MGCKLFWQVLEAFPEDIMEQQGATELETNEQNAEISEGLDYWGEPKRAPL